MKNLLIVIPAYNEEDNIGMVLDCIVKEPIMSQADILVIDDASYDGTRSVCIEKQVTVITNKYNLGYGASLLMGYEYALNKGYDYVIQMDADGQHDACNISAIYDALCAGEKNTDIVIGSRFIEGKKTYNVGFLKTKAIKYFSRLIYLLSKQKINDPTSGLQGLNRKTLYFYCNNRGFDRKFPDANVLLLMILKGYSILEIPANMHERKSGKTMHSGLINQSLYMIYMTFSCISVWLKNK